MIDILVPVLDRPQNAQRLVDSIQAATVVPHRVLFLCTPFDDAEIAAIHATGADLNIVRWEAGPGDWAKKINAGYRLTDRPYMLLGADDLRFHSGWDTEVLRVAEGTGAGVIGTNDLGNATVMRGLHSTHPLVRRSYVDEYGTIDEPDKVLHEGYRHQWCNPPDAPIWMGDLGSRLLGDIDVGDEVIGWERRFKDGAHHSLNYLTTATVLDIVEREAPLVNVTFVSGRKLICTPDHLWLNGHWSPSTPRQTEWINARIGSSLVHVVDQPRELHGEELRLAGWLGGIYDGEGSGMYAALQSAKANPDVVEEIDRVLSVLGIPFTRGVRPSQGQFGTDVTEFILTGGRRAYVDFILLTQPVKRQTMLNRILERARFGQKDKIVDVSPAGRGEVLSMKTSTGNYVAWGFASKNCDTELIATAQMRHQWTFAKASHVEHLHPMWHKSEMDATYEKALSTPSEDHAHFNSRKRLWSRAAMKARSE
jgi:hypothetical protein